MNSFNLVSCMFQCLAPVLACDGWSITTIEGLGNKDKGYHPIQVISPAICRTIGVGYETKIQTALTDSYPREDSDLT